MNDETEDDIELFRSAMRDVTPLKDRGTIRTRPPRQARPPRLQPQDTSVDTQPRFSLAGHGPECPSRLEFHRGGIRNAILKKLRQGKLPIDSTLDLHGLTIDSARSALSQFLDECRELNHRSVLIVHGKGHRSSGHRPVIKPMVNRWLQQADEVLAFCSARPADGGTGAVYVLLKTN